MAEILRFGRPSYSRLFSLFFFPFSVLCFCLRSSPYLCTHMLYGVCCRYPCLGMYGVSILDISFYYTTICHSTEYRLMVLLADPLRTVSE